MNNAKTCSNCLGSKKELGNGMMEKNCSVCEGLGWVSMEKELFTEEHAADKIAPTKKPRGRPRRDEKN